ncbi:MAG: SEC-C domain-containing protein [Pirellulaceae bacterium]|jgi:hypothetical protein|nr:SEC-C domain-containing protein [Pirellulaceae bacterium]
MGAIAEAIAAFAQPLLDQTDGSLEDLNRALALSQLCFNLALIPEEGRDQALSEMRLSIDMDDEEFDDFRRSLLEPMIRRHKEMFPLMHNSRLRGSWHSALSADDASRRWHSSKADRAEAYPGTDRYAPCPCNSGRKYKFCCGRKSR